MLGLKREIHGQKSEGGLPKEKGYQEWHFFLLVFISTRTEGDKNIRLSNDG